MNASELHPSKIQHEPRPNYKDDYTKATRTVKNAHGASASPITPSKRLVTLASWPKMWTIHRIPLEQQYTNDLKNEIFQNISISAANYFGAKFN